VIKMAMLAVISVHATTLRVEAAPITAAIKVARGTDTRKLAVPEGDIEILRSVRADLKVRQLIICIVVIQIFGITLQGQARRCSEARA
jgi:peroxiredoxin family protein